MRPDRNKNLVREFVEQVFNQGNLDATDWYFAKDVVDYSPLPGQAPGLEGLKASFGAFLRAFPDARASIEDLVAEGDRVALRFAYRGTHLGEFLGMRPSGKRFSVTGIAMFRVREGRIAEHWVELDQLGLLQQIGSMPVAPGATGR